MSLLRQVSSKTTTFIQHNRSLFYWVHLQFNVVDENRKKLVGADRTCAEWILRNGGKVKYSKNSSEATSDYNELPKDEDHIDIHLTEIDASDTLIMHNGFDHLNGCKYITKATFDNCGYFNDKCLAELRHLENSLLLLQVSRCAEVSEAGLLHLPVLKKLKNLRLFDLPKIKDKSKVLQTLKSNLPQCNINFD